MPSNKPSPTPGQPHNLPSSSGDAPNLEQLAAQAQPATQQLPATTTVEVEQGPSGLAEPPSETNAPTASTSTNGTATPRPIDPDTNKPYSDYKWRLKEAGRAEFAVQVPVELHTKMLEAAKEDGDIALVAWTRKIIAAALGFVLTDEPTKRARSATPGTNGALDPKFVARKDRNVAQVALLLYKANKKNDAPAVALLEAQMEKLQSATNEEELVAAGAKPARERKPGDPGDAPVPATT